MSFAAKTCLLSVILVLAATRFAWRYLPERQFACETEIFRLRNLGAPYPPETASVMWTGPKISLRSGRRLCSHCLWLISCNLIEKPIGLFNSIWGPAFSYPRRNYAGDKESALHVSVIVRWCFFVSRQIPCSVTGICSQHFWCWIWRHWLIEWRLCSMKYWEAFTVKITRQ